MDATRVLQSSVRPAKVALIRGKALTDDGKNVRVGDWEGSTEGVSVVDWELEPVTDDDAVFDGVGLHDRVCVRDAERDLLAVLVGVIEPLLLGLPQYP